MKSFSKKLLLICSVYLVIAGMGAAFAQNRVVNGNFTAGNSGFVSDYTYVAPAPNALQPEGLYTVHTNPRDVHNDFCNMGDHTTGSGMMMIVNGDPNTTKRVWQGTTNTDLVIGRQYDFEAWVTNVTPFSPAILSFYADGVYLGTITASGNCSWQRMASSFVAQSLRPTLVLMNAQSALAGNDFAIDDIDVSEIPEIDVQRPAGTSIADGSSDDQGLKPPTCGNSVTYTIVNSGYADLVVSSLTVPSQSNVSGVSLGTTLPMTIGPGSQQTLTINYCVNAPGAFYFDIRLYNNDSNENPYDIRVHGIGGTPEINVQRPPGTDLPDGSTDNVGHLLIGCGRSLTYTIQNLGSATLNITSANAFNLANVSEYTVVTALPMSIPIGGSATLTVTYCLIAPGPFGFDIAIVNDDPDEGTYDIAVRGTAWPPPKAIFYATPTMGCPWSKIYFENRSQGMTNEYWWDFGDGEVSNEKSPFNLYTKAGLYTVRLIAANPAARDTLTIENFIDIYGWGYKPWAPLVLVNNSFAYPEESWENAIDGDISGWKGTATVEGTPPYVPNGNPPFAIFAFADGTTKLIRSVRLLTDTWVGFEDRWVHHFRVFVSTTGTSDSDFSLVLQGAKKIGGWEEFTFTPVQAKYIKLVIDKPKSGWRQLGEFQVCPARRIPDPARCTMVATTPHKADGMDKSKITMTIRDAQGELISGYLDPDFCVWATPEPNLFFPVVETESPGVYVTYLATIKGGVKTFGASVVGVPIGTTKITFGQPALKKAALAFVSGSAALTVKGEGWDNAIDGDVVGWDGTTTASGSPCYAIFKFADNAVKTLQRLDMLTNTGVGYEARWVKRFRVMVSTTGIQDADFAMAYSGLQTTGDWQQHVFPAVSAKYIKLIIDMPTSGWRQIGEIEAYVSEGSALSQQSQSEDQLAVPAAIPTNFSVSNGYPNPFNPETQLELALPEASQVTIIVYNTLGQKVRTLVQGELGAGFHTITWNGMDDASHPLPSGNYFIHIKAGDNATIRKVTMMK